MNVHVPRNVMTVDRGIHTFHNLEFEHQKMECVLLVKY